MVGAHDNGARVMRVILESRKIHGLVVSDHAAANQEEDGEHRAAVVPGMPTYALIMSGE
jgi:hypothetical protein